MRAGAREFLVDPLLPGSVAEALVRASARRDELHRHRNPIASGKLLVFAGAKGGSGVTTVASNFALALAREPGIKVGLLDLDVMGDAALTAGLTSKFSLRDAIEQNERLDVDLLSALMTKHSSGLFVLAATDAAPESQPPTRAIEKLAKVAREGFDYVVVDAGTRALDLYQPLLRAASVVYLVTQVGVSELRNANRFIVWYLADGGRNLEVVLNRFQPRNIEIDEAAVSNALTRPAKWKIPNDYQAVRRAQTSGIQLASENGQIARLFAEMAMAATGRVAPAAKKKFSLFGGKA
jgi:pilus assembly protein CpaE